MTAIPVDVRATGTFAAAIMSTLTTIHVLISLLGILSGFVATGGFLFAKPLPQSTFVFLTSTIATSVTGFFFPFHGFTPAIGFGLLSLPVLAISVVALYRRHLAGAWRWIYVLSAIFAFYLNFFVLVVQLFLKVPRLNALAPTQPEPPFVIAQTVTLVAFAVAAVLATRRFHLPISTVRPA